MGHMKELDRRIRQGGDDALAAVGELLQLWMPVSDRLPAMGQRVMIGHATDGWVGIGERAITGAYMHWADDGEELHEPTHWMPLPDPPEANQ